MSRPTFKRANRVADQIRTEIADILLRKTKDSRLQSLTVTDVEVTDDLRLARVYVTTLLEGEEQRQLMQALGKASGFLRKELGLRMALRYSPVLEFHEDLSGPRGDRILALLDTLHSEPPEESGGDQPETT